MNDGRHLQKIYIVFGYVDDVVWAKPFGDNLYQIQSIPYLPTGVHFEDVVSVRQSTFADKRLYVEKVVHASGHRTLLVDFDDLEAIQVEEILAELRHQQARYEHDSEKKEYYAVDIPPEADYAIIYSYLQGLEQRKILNLFGEVEP